MFPKNSLAASDWLFVLQWMQSPTAWHTSHARPCVVTPWHVFGDVMIVLFCKHISCGHWVLVLRICMLTFLLKFSSITIRIGNNSSCVLVYVPRFTLTFRLLLNSLLVSFRGITTFSNCITGTAVSSSCYTVWKGDDTTKAN